MTSDVEEAVPMPRVMVKILARADVGRWLHSYREHIGAKAREPFRAALDVIRDDAHPLALGARKQRGCCIRCGCSDCDVLDDIERALVKVGWLALVETRAHRSSGAPHDEA